MWKKCLMLSCLFCVIFTIKSMATTYDASNPLEINFNDYGNDIRNTFTYDYLTNLNLDYYDFFMYHTKTSGMGNIYNMYGNIIYINKNTNEIIFHVYASGYSYSAQHTFYYVHGNTVNKINASHYINGSNYSHGDCVIFYSTNNDGTLNTLYFADQVNGNGNNNVSNQTNRLIYTNDNNIYIGALRCYLFL